MISQLWQSGVTTDTIGPAHFGNPEAGEGGHMGAEGVQSRSNLIL